MSDPTMVRFRAKKIDVEEGRRGQSEVHQSSRTPLLMLFAITGIVLLTACANIANLLLARGAGARSEMSVRLSLGAGRKHLLAQLLTESILLGAMGGLAGILVAEMDPGCVHPHAGAPRNSCIPSWAALCFSLPERSRSSRDLSSASSLPCTARSPT